MWHQYLVQKQKHKHCKPLGLKNAGKTCYSNVVFQCLTYCPPLAVLFLKSTHSSSCNTTSKCPLCILESRIRRSLELKAESDNPSFTNSHLPIWSTEDIDFEYQKLYDPSIFFKRVMGACFYVKGAVKFKKLFELAERLDYSCVDCGRLSVNDGNLGFDLTLDIDDSACKTLMDALASKSHQTARKCKQCKEVRMAQAFMSVYPAPSVLVIHLKRFIGSKKIISFEENLCVRSKKETLKYKLFGTIVHKGDSPSEGHYRAYIKDAAGSWYHCDDSKVDPSTFEEVKKEKVCILFFSSTKQSEKNEKRRLKYQSIDLPTDAMSSKFQNMKKELHEIALSNLRNSNWFKNVCEAMRSKMAGANNVNEELLTEADKLTFWEQALDQVEDCLVEHIRSSTKENDEDDRDEDQPDKESKEIPKKAEPSKKRPADSATKTPAPDKKAKIVIPQKPE